MKQLYNVPETAVLRIETEGNFVTSTEYSGGIGFENSNSATVEDFEWGD